MKSGTVVSKNGIYDVVNNDGNNDDIEFEEQNTPTPTPQLLLKKRDPLLRDDPMGDDSEENLGSFTVNVPPPKINSPTTNNGFYKFNNDWNALIQGSSEDHDLIIQVPNTTETLTATQNKHTYTPTQGNVGFSSVTVEVPQPSVESTQTVNITENTTTIVTPSSGYDSIGRLEITTAIPSQVNNQTLSTITENGNYTPENGYSGFNSFTVNVPQPSIQQNKSITLNSNETVTINPDTNYDALGQITITTEVPTTDTVINNQNVNNRNLITRNGFYAPDSQHTGFNAFTVAVPLQKDKNINVNGKQGQTIVWTPDAGYAGFEKTTIKVIPPAFQTKTITSNGTYYPDSNYDGFSSIVVNVPSSSSSSIKLNYIKFYSKTVSLSGFNSLPYYPSFPPPEDENAGIYKFVLPQGKFVLFMFYITTEDGINIGVKQWHNTYDHDVNFEINNRANHVTLPTFYFKYEISSDDFEYNPWNVYHDSSDNIGFLTGEEMVYSDSFPSSADDVSLGYKYPVYTYNMTGAPIFSSKYFSI